MTKVVLLLLLGMICGNNGRGVHQPDAAEATEQEGS